MIQVLSALVFWLFALIALVYGWLLNRGRERALVAAIGVAIAATAALGLGLAPMDAHRGILIVDACLALFAVWVAVHSMAHWPMWFAAFALVGALTAIANSWMGSEYWLFRMLTGFWAVPALFALLIGSLRDRRARDEGGHRRTRRQRA